MTHPHRRPFRLAPLALLAGCSQIKDIQETVEGLTNPLVAQGIVLGVEQPSGDSGLDLSETRFATSAWAELFLADAASVDDMADAPVGGASASLSSASNGTLSLVEEGEGRYAVDADGGLAYAQEVLSLSVSLDDGAHGMRVTAPPPPDADLPTAHSAGQPLSVDLAGQGFDSVLVVVLDAASLELSYSNEPADIQELYEFGHGGTGDSVEIPGDAFPGDSLYAVGVAGLVTADAADLDEVNTALSSMLAGKFRFYPVQTGGR